MSLTQQQINAFKGYRGDCCCKQCNWFGHMVHYCQYEERMRERDVITLGYIKELDNKGRIIREGYSNYKVTNEEHDEMGEICDLYDGL